MCLLDRDTVLFRKILLEDCEGTLHILLLLPHRSDIVENAFSSFPTCKPGDHPCSEIVGR